MTLLEMTYPVRDPDGTWIGAVRALVDANDLYTVLAPVRVGRTGHAVLLRATDGLVLASDESERILKTTYPGFDSLRAALEGFPIGESGQALFGRSRFKRGYWTIPEVNGVEPARLVGFSPIDQRRRQVAGRGRAGPLGGPRPDPDAHPLSLDPLHRRLRDRDPARALLLLQARAAGDGGEAPPARGARARGDADGRRGLISPKSAR